MKLYVVGTSVIFIVFYKLRTLTSLPCSTYYVHLQPYRVLRTRYVDSLIRTCLVRLQSDRVQRTRYVDSPIVFFVHGTSTISPSFSCLVRQQSYLVLRARYIHSLYRVLCEVSQSFLLGSTSSALSSAGPRGQWRTGKNGDIWLMTSSIRQLSSP